MDINTLPEIDWLGAEYQDIESAVKAIAPYQKGEGIVRSQRGLEPVSYEAVVKAVRDPRFSMGMPARLDMAGVTGGVARESMLNFLFSREGVDHTRARKACAPWFSASGAEQLRSQTAEWLDTWLDELVVEADDLDFLNKVSNRLPATLYCLMIGAPLTDAPFIQHMSEEVMLLTAPPAPDHGRRIEAAAAQTKEYLIDSIEDRRKNRGEDLLSFMVGVEETGEINTQDILAVAFNSLVGSTDTTSAQICLNLQGLAQNPDQWDILKHEPERVPHAVMELLRWNPGAWAVVRSPIEPLEYEGVHLDTTDSIFPGVFAANNDPTVFEDPRRLDVTRDHPKIPLNFGGGRHGCLGRMVTLMEQEEALRAVLRKWDSVEITSSKFTGAMFSLAAHEFRVRFTPAAK